MFDLPYILVFVFLHLPVVFSSDKFNFYKKRSPLSTQLPRNHSRTVSSQSSFLFLNLFFLFLSKTSPLCYASMFMNSHYHHHHQNTYNYNTTPTTCLSNPTDPLHTNYEESEPVPRRRSYKSLLRRSYAPPFSRTGGGKWVWSRIESIVATSVEMMTTSTSSR